MDARVYIEVELTEANGSYRKHSRGRIQHFGDNPLFHARNVAGLSREILFEVINTLIADYGDIGEGGQIALVIKR